LIFVDFDGHRTGLVPGPPTDFAPSARYAQDERMVLWFSAVTARGAR
jgi:hypothetical protein